MIKNLFLLIASSTFVSNLYASDKGYIADDYYKHKYQSQEKKTNDDKVYWVKEHLSKVNDDAHPREHYARSPEFKSYVNDFLTQEKNNITQYGNAPFRKYGKGDSSLFYALSLSIQFSTSENFFYFYNHSETQKYNSWDLYTFLNQAAQYGRMDILQSLLEIQDQNIFNYTVQSMLEAAASGGKVDVINYLLHHKKYGSLLNEAEENEKPLIDRIVYKMLREAIKTPLGDGVISYLDSQSLPMPNQEQLNFLFEDASCAPELLNAFLKSQNFKPSQKIIDDLYLKACKESNNENILVLSSYISPAAKIEGEEVLHFKRSIDQTIAFCEKENKTQYVFSVSPTDSLEHANQVPAPIPLNQFIMDIFSSDQSYDVKLADGVTESSFEVEGGDRLGALLQGMSKSDYSQDPVSPYKIDVDPVNHSITLMYALFVYKKTGYVPNKETDINPVNIKLKQYTKDRAETLNEINRIREQQDFEYEKMNKEDVKFESSTNISTSPLPSSELERKQRAERAAAVAMKRIEEQAKNFKDNNGLNDEIKK